MGTGWRRAFCTRDPQSTIHNQHRSQSPPPTCVSLGFLSSTSNPSTPPLHHQQSATANDNPRFQSKSTPNSNPTSPRSPNLKLSLFKNSFKFRSSCGICLNSVKTGQGTAIYTAECAHAFHFPCIASHVHTHGILVCPICNATWNDVPLLQQNDDIVVNTIQTQINHQQQPSHSDSVRSYDDDEPLLSPFTVSGQIVPIPEADENGEEEDENDDAGEFQGFFVNPKPPSSLQINDGDSRSVRVKLMPECAVISVSRSHETYALVLRVKAPPPSPMSQRAPMDLVTVLDIGGNMTGAKLHMLKSAMRLVISSLGSADRLAIVAFSATSKRLLPLRRMTAQGQRVARRVVDRIVSGHGNSEGESEALRKATKVLEDRRERNPVANVMILSDGHDGKVQTGNNTIQRKCLSHVSSTRFAIIDIPVHSFGFEIPVHSSGILSAVVQDLKIQFGFSAPAEISAVYTCGPRPTALSTCTAGLGDLYAEEERELLVEFKVPTSALGSHHVMTVRCLYNDPASNEVVYGRKHALPVSPPRKSAAHSVGRVERLRNVFITSRAIAESRRLAVHSEFSSAHHLLASARDVLVRSSSASAQEYLRGLEAELMELHWRKQQQQTILMQRRRGRELSLVDENGEALTPTSAWRAAEKLAKIAMMKKSMNKVSDLHGFENARF
ncbi:E3 ubiquitin-protein ligase WAV3-like [Gastrolobium bilobum]|uniref:E3 ubiquitin-protein ligase WAV3-like n=1 Tax=Gastrolobium bilobum TaxID=150636 RepID=UPI002AB156C3|nr:E3 ubiquitin-protein ligase WAV3-like [Gastrolobium bilobum]